jgi:hypothetical protein
MGMKTPRIGANSGLFCDVSKIFVLLILLKGCYLSGVYYEMPQYGGQILRLAVQQ